MASIASVDGCTITLSSQLAKDHLTPQRDMDVHIAKKTRNVRFTSVD